MGRIPAGHKVAVRAHAVGEPVRRYGQIIGFATAADRAGRARARAELRHGRFRQGLRLWAAMPRPTDYLDRAANFQGIRRADGQVATRNYIGILTSVNCSAHVAGVVADCFQRNPFTGDDPLADFPNVDGVVALTHKTGCGMTQGEPLTVAAADAGRLRAAPEFRRRDRARPRLRGEPDRRRCSRSSGCAGRLQQHGHPGRWAAAARRSPPASPS